ncbi:MAG: YigZ family protein, partial [Lachnospiraceae bacterium]
KKSRFIANIHPVESEEEAAAFIDAMKKKFYDARHNCWAYITGSNGQLSKSSDDGEPAHTAGRPMMDILKSAGLNNVCVVVTRYFGGILLGTGGLVRAYSDAVKTVLEECEIYELSPYLTLHIATDYSSYGKIEYMSASKGYIIKNTVYTDGIEFDLFIPPSEETDCISVLTNLTGGKCRIETGDIINM